MNPVMLILAMLADLLRENLPEMTERLPAPLIQKFRDALQEIEAVLANPLAGVPIGGDPYEPTMPPIVQEMLSEFRAEMQRRIEVDNTNAAIANRTAVALERLADGADKVAGLTPATPA